MNTARGRARTYLIARPCERRASRQVGRSVSRRRPSLAEAVGPVPVPQDSALRVDARRQPWRGTPELAGAARERHRPVVVARSSTTWPYAAGPGSEESAMSLSRPPLATGWRIEDSHAGLDHRDVRRGDRAERAGGALGALTFVTWSSPLRFDPGAAPLGAAIPTAATGVERRKRKMRFILCLLPGLDLF